MVADGPPLPVVNVTLLVWEASITLDPFPPTVPRFPVEVEGS
jgi:hypothetical protein